MNVKSIEYFNISDALIGVHCTHGVNRTGYLICRYLIEKLDWDPQKAIDEFKIHRGHPIERQNYLDDLKKGKWAAPEEQPESQGSNPRGSQFDQNYRYSSRQFSSDRRERYQWTDRRPRAYLNRDSRWGNNDRNWPDQQNGINFQIFY